MKMVQVLGAIIVNAYVKLEKVVGKLDKVRDELGSDKVGKIIVGKCGPKLKILTEDKNRDMDDADG